MGRYSFMSGWGNPGKPMKGLDRVIDSSIKKEANKRKFEEKQKKEEKNEKNNFNGCYRTNASRVY